MPFSIWNGLEQGDGLSMLSKMPLEHAVRKIPLNIENTLLKSTQVIACADDVNISWRYSSISYRTPRCQRNLPEVRRYNEESRIIDKWKKIGPETPTTQNITG